MLCDWLPWNHVFGGSHNFGIVLYNGGTLYIDEGKPTPGAFDDDRAQPARGRVHRVLQRAARLRDARAVPARRRRAARALLPPRGDPVLRGGRPGSALLGRAAGARRRDVRRANPHGHRARRDRERAVRAVRRERRRARRDGRASRARRGAQARARSARSSRRGCAGRASRRDSGATDSARAPRSTRRATTGSATRSRGSIPTTRRRGSRSTAGWTRTSSSRPAPG